MQFVEKDPEMPEPLYRLLTGSDYDHHDGVLSATTLGLPPQVVQLTRRHGHKVLKDPEEAWLSVLGACVHDKLDRINDLIADSTIVAETRMFIDVTVQVDGASHTVRVSGKPDYFDSAYEYDFIGLRNGGLLDDYKVTKASTARYGGKKEWTYQLNIYAHILRKNGYTVNRALIWAMFRDWSKMEAAKYKNYPQKGVQKFEIELWPDDVVAAFIRERVWDHIHAQSLPDEALPACSMEDRWKRDVYLVREIGVPGAARQRCDTLEEAQAAASELGPGFTYSPRIGPPIRCQKFCDVAPYCWTLKRERGEMPIASNSTKDKSV